MAKSTSMLLFALLLVPFLLSDEESYEYEPGMRLAGERDNSQIYMDNHSQTSPSFESSSELSFEFSLELSLLSTLLTLSSELSLLSSLS